MKMVKIDKFTKRGLKPHKCSLLNRPLKDGEPGVAVLINTVEAWRKGGRLELSYGAVKAMGDPIGLVPSAELVEARIDIELLKAEKGLLERESELLADEIEVLRQRLEIASQGEETEDE